jgi:hypothetical protein
MSFSSVFDLVVGMAVIYYALSLLVSYITSWLGDLFQIRARNLARMLGEVLGSKEGLKLVDCDKREIGVAHPVVSVEDFLCHPWIRSLAPRVLTWFGLGADKMRLVDRISAERFASTFIELLYPAAGGESGLDLERFRQAVEALPDGDHKRALLAAINDSLKQVEDLRLLIETWYDNIMQTVAALYKQRMRAVTIAVALVVTLIAGVDSVAIGRTLWNNPAAQAGLVGLADQIKAVEGQGQLEGEAKKLLEELQKLEAESGFTVFWTCADLNRALSIISGRQQVLACNAQPAANQPPAPELTNNEFLGLKLLGLAITWLAIAQGSSFWYQILKGIRTKTDEAGKQSPSSEFPGQAAPGEVSAAPSSISEAGGKTGTAPGPAPVPGPVPEKEKPAPPERLDQLANKVLEDILASGVALKDVDISEAITELISRANAEDLDIEPSDAVEAMRKALKQKGLG